MVLKAVLLEFSGVVIRDAKLRKNLIDEILISENLRPDAAEFSDTCLGRSDRTCLKQLLHRRGRTVSDDYLDRLLGQKAIAYTQLLSRNGAIPLYPGLEDFLFQLKSAAILVGLVTGAYKAEVDWVLSNANLPGLIPIVTGEALSLEADKPSSALYEQALLQLRQTDETLCAQDCLAVEASFAGIEAAKQAHIPVVGVANLYPYQMMQRRADWAVDYLNDIEVPWIQRRYSTEAPGSGDKAMEPLQRQPD